MKKQIAIMLKNTFLLSALLIFPLALHAQFIDHFETDNLSGWDYYTGDGEATMTFTPNKEQEIAQITVDATNDRHNVWWAIIKRNVAPALDLKKLEHPEYELRVEAKVKVSEAPRRLNFMVNTQRTTDFHKQLKEYDIADTTGWHIISMTTRDLDAIPGDSLYVQLGVTDWGRRTYQVELDYYKATIINVNEAEPDKGEPLTYHPPVPDIQSFVHHQPAAQSAIVNTRFPETNFHNWQDVSREIPVLSVAENQWVVFRWDFNNPLPARVNGAGLLELTTYSLFDGGQYEAVFGEDLGMEFGKIRVIEILGGQPNWQATNVTYRQLTGGKPYHKVFNEQMVFDAEVHAKEGGKTYITLPRPVMQRLLEGTTKGLLIRPLGAIQPTFYAEGRHAPTLHYSLLTN